jgi:hypothetical protein
LKPGAWSRHYLPLARDRQGEAAHVRRTPTPFFTTRHLSGASGKVAICLWVALLFWLLVVAAIRWGALLSREGVDAIAHAVFVRDAVIGLALVAGIAMVLTWTLNRTELLWDGAHLILREGPVPWWSRQRFQVEAIAGFCQEPGLRVRHLLADLLWGNHCVMVVLRDRRRVTLMSGYPNAAEAGLTVQMLEAQLDWRRRHPEAFTDT